MTPSSQLPANANASRRAFIGHEGSAPRARGKMNYDGYFSGFRGFAGGVLNLRMAGGRGACFGDPSYLLTPYPFTYSN